LSVGGAPRWITGNDEDIEGFIEAMIQQGAASDGDGFRRSVLSAEKAGLIP
jgi:hypothetical protein